MEPQATYWHNPKTALVTAEVWCKDLQQARSLAGFLVKYFRHEHQARAWVCNQRVGRSGTTVYFDLRVGISHARYLPTALQAWSQIKTPRI